MTTEQEQQKDEEVLFVKTSDESNENDTLECTNSSPMSISGHGFDEIVGFLEGMLVDEIFLRAQNDFFDRNKDVFADEPECGSGLAPDQENKLEYMNVFQKYCEFMESHIEHRLISNFTGLCIAEVAHALIENAKDVTDDVIDMLVSITDFKEFKDLILSYSQSSKYTRTNQGLNIVPVEHYLSFNAVPSNIM